MWPMRCGPPPTARYLGLHRDDTETTLRLHRDCDETRPACACGHRQLRVRGASQPAAGQDARARPRGRPGHRGRRERGARGGGGGGRAAQLRHGAAAAHPADRLRRPRRLGLTLPVGPPRGVRRAGGVGCGVGGGVLAAWPRVDWAGALLLELSSSGPPLAVALGSCRRAYAEPMASCGNARAPPR